MAGSCWDINTAASISSLAPTSFPAVGGTKKSSATTTSPKPAAAPSPGFITIACAGGGFCRDGSSENGSNCSSRSKRSNRLGGKPMQVKNFEDLEIWKDARALTRGIYQLTKNSKS